MADNNKKHFYVRKDRNGWFNFSRGGVRLQLCGDQRKGGFWLKQYAQKAGLDSDKFMLDLTKILTLMEQDKQAIFSMYEPLHSKQEQE